MFMDEIDGVGTVHTMFVALRQPTPLITQTMCPHCFVNAIDEGFNGFLLSIPCKDVMYLRLEDVLSGEMLCCQVFEICSSIVMLPVNGA